MSHLISFPSLVDRTVLVLMQDVVWKSAVVLIAAAVASRLTLRLSAAIRHQVWVMAVVAALLMPFAVAFLPSLRVAILPPAVGPTAERLNRSSPEGDRATRGEAEPCFPVAVTPPGLPRVMAELAAVPREVRAGARNAIHRGTPRAVATATDGPAVPIHSVVFTVWLTGLAIVIGPFVGLLLVQWWNHRQYLPLSDPGWNATVTTLSRQLGLQREVKSFASDRNNVPAVCGLLQPYLVLPRNWGEWSDEQRRCVLLHELAHVKRADVLTQFLGRLAAAVYWFNPLAWYAVRQLRVERELACDDCVLSTGHRPSDYARQLVQMLRMYRPERLAIGVAMTHSARLDQRVRAILDETRCRWTVSPSAARSGLIGIALLAGLLGATSPVTRAVQGGVPDQAAGTNSRADETVPPTKRSDALPAEDAKKLVFRGQVLHGDEPIAGASLQLWQRIGPDGFYAHWHPRESIEVEPRLAAVSDDRGNFEFVFSPQEMTDTPWNIWPDPWKQVQVVASKNGMGVGWCQLGELQARQKIWIRGTVPLRGRVIDLEGQPVPDCAVRFFNLSAGVPAYSELWQPTWVGLSPQVTTDADGRFVMYGLPSNRKGIRLSASGPTIATKIFSVNLGMEEGKPVEVTVEPTQPIAGIVRDLETGQPVPGVVVYGEEQKMHRQVRAVSDENGAYRLIGLPKAKHYKLTTYAPFSSRYLVRYSSVADRKGTETIAHDMALRRGIPVHLTVVDKRTRERLHPEVHYAPTDDNPLHQEATRGAYKPGDGFRQFHAPDEDGVVRFVAYPGRGLVYAVLQGTGDYLPVGDTPEIMANQQIDVNFGFAALSPAYAVMNPKPDADVVEIELEADPGERQSARLLDPAGHPVRGAIAHNQHFNEFEAEHAFLGGAGQEEGSRLENDTFEASLLRPSHPRLLIFRQEDRRLIGMTIARAGQPLADVVMQEWGLVEGRVLNADGEPLAGIEVAVDYPHLPAEGRWPARPTAHTDLLGRFVIGRLIPNLSHQLTVYAPEGRQAATRTDLQPEPGQRIDAGTFRLP